MEEKTKQDLVQFLRKSINVFAWSHKNMPGIDSSVITYRLNMYPSSKSVRQKKRVFASEWDNAIKERGPEVNHNRIYSGSLLPGLVS